MSDNLQIAVTSYLARKGFAETSGPYRSKFTHPIGLTGEIYFSKINDRVEVTFEGPTVKRPRTMKYTFDNINALFSRVDRLLRETANEAARRRTAEDRRQEKINRIVNDLSRYSGVTVVNVSDYTASVTAGYRGVEFRVDSDLTVRPELASSNFAYVKLQIDQYLKLLDFVVDSNMLAVKY